MPALPVSVIVVIALSLLVLSVVAAYFLIQSWSQFSQIDHGRAFLKGCMILIKNCSADPNDINITGYPYSLMKACEFTGHAMAGNVSACKVACGCE